MSLNWCFREIEVDPLGEIGRRGAVPFEMKHVAVFGRAFDGRTVFQKVCYFW